MPKRHRFPWGPLLALFLALFTLQGMAQQKKRSGVVLYKDRLAAQFDTVKTVKNVLKLNPLLFFRGEIPLYYERALSPRLSLEAGVGFTWRNFVNLSFSGADADDYGAGTEIKARPTVHLGVRYYLLPDLEPQGTYLQLGLSHVEYAKDIVKVNPDGSFSNEKELDQRIYNDVRLYLGHQLISATSNWLIDIYGGVGMRDRSMRIVKETLDLTNNTWSYDIEDKNDLVPVLYLGVKVGLGF